MNKSTVYDSTIIKLPKINNVAGNITAIENKQGILPFDIKRVFYLYDIPGGESRGAHAHKECHQFLIPASGAFEVLLDDGRVKRQVQLNRPYFGLYIPPGIWAQEVNFASGAICLVLASDTYRENDYIRDYTFFGQFKKVNFVHFDMKFLEKSWKWLNDPEIKKLTLTENFTREDQKLFYSSIQVRKDYLIFGITYDDEPIGACGLKGIKNGQAEYWGYIGEKKFWGKGIGQLIIDEMVSVARKNSLDKLILYVSKDNLRAIKSYKKYGFIVSDVNDLIKMKINI